MPANYQSNDANYGISGKVVFSFLISILLSSLVIVVAIRNRVDIERMAMERLVIEKSITINEIITRLLFKSETLASLVIEHDGNINDFDRVAASIVDDPSILNILIAPNGVVSHIYPLAGNERAVGLDFFTDGPGNREAREAKEKNALVFGGPFTLVQGGQALVGRLPVWLPNGQGGAREFWGLVSVTLKYPDVLAGAGLESLEQQGFIYEIWRINPDDDQRQAIARSGDIQGRHLRFVEEAIPIQNAEWFFRMAPLLHWYEHTESWLMIVVGLMLSTLVALVVRNNEQLRAMKNRLEDLLLVDSLTGLRNRNGLARQVDCLMRPGMDLRLVFIDLNHFKQINDAFGHNIGDLVLVEFARRVSRHIDGSRLFARVGGDEFVLVLINNGQEQIDSFRESVLNEFRRPVFHDSGRGQDILLSFNWGTASFPADAASFKELVSLASLNMSRQKNDLDRGKADFDTPPGASPPVG